MIPISLHLQNKNVLIVGSGKVALRKIRQMLKEKANITVLSPEKCVLEVHQIYDYYDPKYLDNMFLVYAATNQKDVNHQIVADCNKRNILCGSAKYDNEASFYSMNSVENEIGMIGLSTNQKIPYSKPVLLEMLQVLENNKERLNLMSDLRPAIIEKAASTKDYFVKLYEIKEEWLNFIHDSTLKKKGYIFIYHPGREEEKFKFNLDPYICVTIEEFKELQEYLIFDCEYHIIPLVLSTGIIYNRIVNQITIKAIIAPPIVASEEDVKKIIELYRSDKETIYIIHPRKDLTLKNMIQNNLLENERVYDFTEQYCFNNQKENRVILFLVTHGGHYQETKEQIEVVEKFGFKIDFCGSLLDHPKIIQWIEDKVR